MSKFIEIVGWILCLTIVLIPFGLALVLNAQFVLVGLEIENNTRILADHFSSATQSGTRSGPVKGASDVPDSTEPDGFMLSAKKNWADGDYSAAIDNARRALRGYSRLYGEKHPCTHQAREMLAQAELAAPGNGDVNDVSI